MSEDEYLELVARMKVGWVELNKPPAIVDAEERYLLERAVGGERVRITSGTVRVNPSASAEQERQGAAQERARILAAIEKCKPTEQPYTRIQWRWEERGAQMLWDKIIKAIEGAQ